MFVAGAGMSGMASGRFVSSTEGGVTVSVFVPCNADELVAGNCGEGVVGGIAGIPAGGLACISPRWNALAVRVW